MKKLLFLFAALFMFAACYDDSDLRSRLEALEQAGYQAQLDALQSSVNALKAVDSEIKNTITALQDSDNDTQKQIDSLKDFDKTLETSISDLKVLIDEKATETKDWVEKTFATLEQYNTIVSDLATLNDLLLDEVADLDSTISANYKALSEEIFNAKSAIEDWISTTLETYCTKEELTETAQELKDELSCLSEKLSALELRVSTIEAQLIAVNGSIESLEKMDTIINRTIELLLVADEDTQSRIDSLKSVDEKIVESIDELKGAIADSVSGTKDWVTATFATLEQYNSLVEDLSDLNDLLISECAALQDSIKKAYQDLTLEISNTKSAIEDWVNSTLEGYCTNGKFNEEISELKDELTLLKNKIDALELRIANLEGILENLTREFTITFSDYDIGILAGKSTSVDYLIKGGTNKTEVKAFGQGGWYAKVLPATDSTGTITVTAPDPLTEYEIIVLVHDGEYRSIMTSINFVTGAFSSIISVQEVALEGGIISIDVKTNMQYEVIIPDNAKSWLSIVETKAMREETITLNCAKNEGLQRTATIKILDEDGNEFSSYAIFQWGVSTEAADMSTNGTANSYIVSSPGYYKFKTTKGNSAESVGTVASAEVLWETFGTDVAPNVGDLISDISYSNDYITFRTGTTYKEGNSLIAAKDANGTILWSWHIWLTDKPEDQVYNNNAGTMMDRNLGATSSTPGDIGALGLLYQWGRKDPFLGSSSKSSSVQAKSTIETWPAAVESNASNGTIAYATANPITFITCNSGNNDWLYTGTNDTDNTRWQSAKTIYDPCPIGYRVPDGGDNGIWATAFGGYIYPSWDETNKGFDFGGTEADKNYLTTDECWYPAAGYLIYNDGRLDYVGDCGYYWSCTPYYNGAYHLYFDVDGYVDPSNNFYRAYGLSVRCLKE